MKNFKTSPLQIITHIATWIPFVILAMDFYTNNLTVNPIQAATIRTGKTALTLLILSLSCNPINLLFNYKPILKLSRPLGIYSFMYASMHAYIFIGIDYGFNWGFIKEALLEKSFALFGLSAYLILLLLTLTSTDGWKKRLKKNWKRLHRFVYLAIVLVITHYILSVKTDYRIPLLYGGVAVILLLLRLPILRNKILEKNK